MTQALMIWVLRLLLGSFMVFAVQAISGKSSMRPAVQLACACFMTVLILEPLLGKQTAVKGLTALIEEAEAQIGQPVEDALHETGIAVQNSIEAELEKLLQGSGISCRLRLTWDDNGSIECIAYWVDSSQTETAEVQLAACTGLPPEKIRYMGEDTDEYS